MDITDRLKKVINWLIYDGRAASDADLAVKLGYTKSSFSMIRNGRVPLTDNFLKNLNTFAPDINIVWIKSGECDMLLSDSTNSEVLGGSIVIQSSVWAVIEKQANSLTARDRQIDNLIDMLRGEINKNKDR